MKETIKKIQGWTLKDIPKRYDKLIVYVEGKGTYSIERIRENAFNVNGIGMSLGRSNGYRADSLEKAKNVIILKITNGKGI